MVYTLTVSMTLQTVSSQAADHLARVVTDNWEYGTCLKWSLWKLFCRALVICQPVKLHVACCVFLLYLLLSAILKLALCLLTILSPRYTHPRASDSPCEVWRVTNCDLYLYLYCIWFAMLLSSCSEWCTWNVAAVLDALCSEILERKPSDYSPWWVPNAVDYCCCSTTK